MEAILIIDIVGTFVFAISGVVAAVERKFDLFGTLILALVTAVGGGTLRDLLIGATPVSWMGDDLHILVIISAIPVAYFFYTFLLRLRKTFLLFDTMGIALFTILGIEKSLSIGLSPVIAVMMGVVSAVFGGVIRDVLSNQVPLIFRKEIYAFACLAGGLVYLGFKILGVWEEFNMLFSVLIVITIRLLAIKRHWSIHFVPRSS